MTEVLYNPKIKPEHLARKAIVYLRQSSEKQVRQNKESQLLQYAVGERVRALGWKQVEIINSDLGSSAGLASAQREGFERVLSLVALGEVGIVGSREVSRLSRTDKDWCRLLEVCQIFGTLIADEQQVYDLNYLDDQLVLGIKGTLSVVELKVIRQRLLAGQESKARRGELFKRLPIGYARDSVGKIAFHPDRRVCEAIQLVFAKFRELWSVRQTFRWFCDHDVELPANPIQGTRLVWKIPSQSLIRDILRNPFYAGAYVWGRRPVTTLLVDGRLEKRQSAMRPAEECRVFIRDHHAGYIDWATYEENRRMMRRNSVNWEGDALEKQGSGPFFNGAKYSLVDAAYAPFLQRYYFLDRVKKLGQIEEYPRLKAWMEALLARPSTHSFPVSEFEAMYREGLRRRNKGVSKFIEPARAAAE